MKNDLSFTGLCSTTLFIGIFLSLHSSPAFAQIEFEKTYSDSNYTTFGRELYPTNDGGYFIQATVESPWTKCLVMRIDSLGNTIDSVVYGDGHYIQFRAYDMVPTFDGGYVVTGDWAIDTTYNMQSYVQKLDGSGNQQWLNVYGTFGKDHGTLIKQLENGNYVVLGDSKDFNFGIDSNQIGYIFNAYLAVFDSNGTMLQIKSIVTMFDSNYWENSFTPFGLVTFNNTIYCLVRYNFNDNNNYNHWLIKLDENMDTLFTVRNLSYAWSPFYNLSSDNKGNLILYSDTNFEFWDTTGNLLFKTSFNPHPPKYSHLNEIRQLSNNTFIGIGSENFFKVGQAGFYNYSSDSTRITLFDSIGNILKYCLITDSNGLNHDGFSVIATPDGGFAFLGYKNFRTWLVKMDSTGYDGFTGLEDFVSQTNTAFSVAPNPASTSFAIKYSTTQPSLLTIRNTYGIIIKQLSLSSNSGSTIVSVDDLSAGVYLLTLTEGDKRISKKVVIANN